MASVILRHPDGSTETIELSRKQPVTIGRQSFNDVCIAEPDVAPMHCRISWNKTGFEVGSGTSNGIEVNLATVAHHMLEHGDIIRVGSCDLIFQDESAAPKDQPHSDAHRGHKHTHRPETSPKADAGARHSSSKHPKEKPADDLSLFDGPVYTESQLALEAALNDGESAKDDEDEYLDELKSSRKPKPAGGPLLAKPVRPGEQEILKSPLVLGLTGGGLALLLVTGIFWFLIAREQSNKLYDQAVSEMNSGQFSQSIATFTKFIQLYPNHGLRRQADRGLGKALISKEISGATPAWKRGLERLNELIKTHRNESDFGDLHSSLFQFAEQISLGAAKTSESTRDPELLVVSKDAQDLLERYADPSAPPTGTVNRINEQRSKARAAIEKQKTFDLAMTSVDAAIAEKKPMLALSERLKLVRSFPEFLSAKRVKDALQKALDLERSVVATEETERPAETTDDPPIVPEPIVGLLHSRSRTDDSSQGQVVFVTAKDLCYAIDPATGELVWRRVIGPRPPFFPIKMTGSQSSVLVFDTRKLALISCHQASGKLIWSQPLGARAVGAPLITDGQIYLPLEGNSLVRIDVDTGRLSATVRFSQNLATTPVLARDGNHLLVPGDTAMIYALSLRTTNTSAALAAVAVTFTDHAPGSISAPPLAMGRLLLLCENDRADSARLRLWDASNPAQSLSELTSTRTVGQVRDTPVLRGNQLVVPSSGEQFAAFAVTDDAGRAGIAPIGQYRADQAQAKNQISSPLFVALGPDGQFWSAGSAFRRFEIDSKSIRMDSVSTAAGIASQPLQSIGEYFFVGRKSRYSDAVTFSAVEREKLVNPWRCIVGDAPLEISATRDGGVVWVGESGSIYSIGKNRMTQGGIDLKAGTDLELPANVTDAIRASLLPDQRIVIAARGESTQLYVLNPNGQLSETFKLDEFPETDPVLLDEGLVLPFPSRLKILPLVRGRKGIQDLLLPVGNVAEHHWSHLVRIDGRELIAINDKGRLTRIQFRSAEVPHLAEAAELVLPSPVDSRPWVRGESLFVADASGVVRQLNLRSFDTDGQATLAAPIRNTWPLEENMLVQSGDNKLHCLAEGKALPEKWVYALEQLDPVGPAIMRNRQVWLACRSGTILVLNADTGEEVRRVVLPQLLSLGLRQVQETLLAVASDGTLYRLE